ncbi:unnamed protein product [Fraxinus pennsylvanica]|uniref:Uncharacterized protein n=1 Tax=Fraxinus pennsylvanica TaxID=56036 RepID=A0AAD2A098_9LAMI|nr:unnamed protein product [Fraxinus pennsylvanica]
MNSTRKNQSTSLDQEIDLASISFTTFLPSLQRWLGNGDSNGQTCGHFACTNCQADLAPNEGISVHAGSILSMSSTPWQCPFLCTDCHDKRDGCNGRKTEKFKVA